MKKRGTSSILSTKAQVSMEYLMVVGFSLVLLMPMIVVFYDQSSSLKDDISAAQLEKIGLELIDAAEEMYYLGAPSQKKLAIYLPPQVNTITISEQEILFNYTVARGTFTYPVTSELPLNMSGTINTRQGKHAITIQAKTNTILFSEST